MHIKNSHLPKEATEMLRKAALDPKYNNDPIARRRAVDNAIDTVKRKYPQYFREDA